MTLYLLLALFGCVVISSSQTSESEVNGIVEEMIKLENQSLYWTYPTNSFSYLNGYDGSHECIYDGTYDFIIVGAGSSGSVLANRLSEIPEWSIQVLEAGNWETALTDIPGIVNYLRTSEYNWGYDTYPQKYFSGFKNNSLVFPTGKALGGGSVTNFMMYVRGNAADYDKWAAMGSPGWSYEEVLPYFKKSERASFAGADPEYHGTRGPVNVEDVPYFDELAQAFLDGQVEMGRKLVDYNGADQMGFSIVQQNEINGTRDSAARAFLAPVKSRRNLNISSETLVLQILIQEFSKRAYGVKYLRNGNCYYSRAKKEVILSAGAMNSPQILMLSGIGPGWHLKEFGIKVLQDLFVGENLWNHVAYSIQSYSVNYTYPDTTLQENVRAYLNAEGILTAPAGIQALGFVNLLNENLTVPNIEYVFEAKRPNVQPYKYYENLYGYTEETYANVLVPQENRTSYVVFAVLLHSNSRGTIRLKSRSPLDYPIIDPKYFTDPDDVQTLTAAVRDLYKLSKTSALRKFDSQLMNVSLPICETYEWGTDDYWACMIENLSDTIHHYGGTCKMGPREDERAVVDPELRVHGIQKLRVVDCSVIPTTLSGHTNAPAYMIGEKAADLIKKQYRRRCSTCPKWKTK